MADPRNIVFMIQFPVWIEKKKQHYWYKKKKPLRTANKQLTYSLIPLVLGALMDHLLDLMLIRLESGRPPWGCSIKQSDSSWRNPAVKRTLTGKSLRRAHKRHTQRLLTRAHTHTHTHTHSLTMPKQTHIAEF